jgi:hypothetical protein
MTLSLPCHCPAILRQCRTRAGRPHAVSGRTMLIHTYHDVPMPRPCHYPAILRPCRTRAGRPHAVSGRPMRIHTYHAVPLLRPCRGLESSRSEWHIRGMAGERHGMCESNTAALCKSNGKDKSKPLAERYGRGTAWYVWIRLKCSSLFIHPLPSTPIAIYYCLTLTDEVESGQLTNERCYSFNPAVRQTWFLFSWQYSLSTLKCPNIFLSSVSQRALPTSDICNLKSS